MTPPHQNVLLKKKELIQSSRLEGVLRIIQKIFFLISQQKHMLGPLIRIVSMTYVLKE